jgi:hypothetical protein
VSVFPHAHDSWFCTVVYISMLIGFCMIQDLVLITASWPTTPLGFGGLKPCIFGGVCICHAAGNCCPVLELIGMWGACCGFWGACCGTCGAHCGICIGCCCLKGAGAWNAGGFGDVTSESISCAFPRCATFSCNIGQGAPCCARFSFVYSISMAHLVSGACVCRLVNRYHLVLQRWAC